MKLKYSLIILSLILLWSGCAHVEAPPGGDEDEQGPVLLEQKPSSGTLNFPLEGELSFKFDEWLANPVPAGAVSLSPPVAERPVIKLRGDVFTVSFSEGLDSNTTYVLGVSSELKDLRSNGLSEPINLVFSTGSVIDSNRLSGRVHPTDSTLTSRKTTKVGLFPLGKQRSKFTYLKKDSLELLEEPNFVQEKARYLTSTDSLGYFEFMGLPEGNYRLLAWEEDNGSSKWEYSVERLARFEKDISLPDTTSLVQMVLSGELKEHRVSKVFRLDSQSVVLTWESKLAPVLADSIKLQMSCDVTVNPVDSLWEDGGEWWIHFENNLSIDSLCFLGEMPKDTSPLNSLEAVNVELDSIEGTVLNDSTLLDPELQNKLSLGWDLIINTPDTNQLKQISLYPKSSYNSSNPLSPDTAWTLSRKTALVNDSLFLSNLRLILNSRDTLNFDVEIIHPFKIKLRPSKELPSPGDFTWVSVSQDTTKKARQLGKYSTWDPLQLASLSGYAPENRFDYAELLGEEGARFGVKLMAQGKFKFEKVPLGNYNIQFWDDTNLNGELDLTSPEADNIPELLVRLPQGVSLREGREYDIEEFLVVPEVVSDSVTAVLEEPLK
ncbi:Ig-like domain-containing protein [Fibrobacterales bacterium]|nr:Ig-like domain-containing protein [Fibrobacterales bacterium]